MDRLHCEAILDILKRYYFKVPTFQRRNFFSGLSKTKIRFLELEILFCGDPPAEKRRKACLRENVNRDENRL